MPLDDEDEVDADEDAVPMTMRRMRKRTNHQRALRAVKSATSSKRGAAATRRGRPRREDGMTRTSMTTR